MKITHHIVISCVIFLISFELPANAIEYKTIGFEFLNDAFFKEDNKISSSWNIDIHSDLAHSWGEFGSYAHKLDELERYLGPTENLFHRITFSLGQVIQTPDDLKRRDLIKDDVPYAALMLGTVNLYSFNREKFNGVQLVMGVVGPLALGEQTQKLIHGEDPKGWTHQLHTEPILNLNFLIKRKVFSMGNSDGFSCDLDVGVHGGIGNLFTQSSVLSDFRFGYNLPCGFNYNPYPIGFSLNYNAEKPTIKNKWSFYCTLGLSGSGFLRNLLFDGNTIRQSHSVEKKRFVAQIFGGIHLVTGRFALRFYGMVTTDDVDVGATYKGADNERFGIVVFEWSF